MKTAVRRVLLLSALLSPSALYALGLGEIRLNSALNQPFDAEIELVSAAAEDLAALRASLASSDTFSRYGLEKPAYLSDFTFRVVRGTNGQDVLRVTSPRPVTEPFVTMLVEASWPRGRLLREYTVLLDPPVYAPGPAASEAPVAAPRAAATAPTPAPVQAVSPAPARAPVSSEPRARQAVATPSIEAGSSYRVRRNDTLWKIASEVTPGSRSDVNRAMVAIFQRNPAAFDGNINVLRAGSLLDIPASSEISSISASAAAAEVSRQYRMWRESSAAASGEAAEGGRLRLVTPEQGTSAASTATVQPAPAAPRTDAATSELQSQVQKLEAELAEARRLLEVRNAELATLQGQAGPTEPAATAAGEAPAAAPSAEPSTTPAAEAPAEPAAAAPQAEEAPPAPAAKQPAAPAEEGPTLLEQLAEYWWVLLGLLAAALAFVLYRRSRGETGAAEEDLVEALARRETGDLRARTAAAAPKARDTDIVVEERRPVQAPQVRPAPVPASPEPSRKPISIEDTLAGEVPISGEAGDPLAEADFHMAYGLYDQAADLVQLAAKREPKRRDLKLKQLEIFFVWGNRDRFLEIAREMNASRADAQPGEWDKIMIMGKQIAPDDALFAGAAHAPSAGLDMELHATKAVLDMDLGATDSETPDIDLSSQEPEVSDGMGLDFVIGEPSRANDEPTQEVGIEDLGLEVGELEQLDDIEGAEDIFAPEGSDDVEETIERPTVERRAPEPEDEDLLSSTSILRNETATLAALAQDEATNVIDLTDMTGELPTVETSKLGGGAGGIDFSLGEEAATMSEVGTKLDLARAYIDMGDPEGARSILEEVQKEGNAVQKQEAERLMASLP